MLLREIRVHIKGMIIKTGVQGAEGNTTVSSWQLPTPDFAISADCQLPGAY
jgi:hypothetical protein